VDEERVYFSWSTPEEYTLLALDHAGEPVWQRNLGPYVSQHSCGASPIVYGDLVIVANDQDVEGGGESFLIAVDRRTGKTAWKIDRKSTVVAYSTPCVRPLADGSDEIIFNSNSHGVTAVDPRKGKVTWEVAGVLDKRSCSSPVITAEGLITISCGSGNGGNYLVAVQPGSGSAPESGKAAYRVDKATPAPYVPTPIARGDLLFLWSDNGIVSCLRSSTGELVWKQRVGGTFFGSPICVADRLFCVNADGEVVVVAAGEEFAELGRNPLGETSHATPAVAGGRMYVRTYRQLHSIGGKTVR
jgi:outer membrane protein assembly factor BamB